MLSYLHFLTSHLGSSIYFQCLDQSFTDSKAAVDIVTYCEARRKVANDHVDKQQAFLSKRKTRMWLSRPAKFLNLSGEKTWQDSQGLFRSPFRVNVNRKHF